VISIGSRYRGPELDGSPFEKAEIAASSAVVDLRGPLVLGRVPLVNAVFIVPGSLGDADFQGLVYGDFSKKDKSIVVRIAVPPEMVFSDQAAEFIVGSLRGANAMAYEFFRQKGEEPFPLREAEELVSRIAERLKVPPLPKAR